MQVGALGYSMRHLLKHAYLLPLLPIAPVPVPGKLQRRWQASARSLAGGAWPLLQQALLVDSQQRDTAAEWALWQQGQRRGTEGHMVSRLPLGKKSAWAEGWREATPAAALEVQVILGKQQSAVFLC